MRFETVTIVGLGYIGLPTAAVLAGAGQSVIGVDVNESVVEAINNRSIETPEPGLADCVNSAVQQGYLKAQDSASKSDVFVICVPTPFLEDKKPDLSFIKASIEMISPVLEPGNLIILESTSPVGTTEQVSAWFKSMRPDLTMPDEASSGREIHIAYCPERILPGNILEELVSNPRVLGGMSEKCSSMAKEFYEIFVTAELNLTDARSAEMAKLVENAYRDVNIAFANELSLICDDLEIDPWNLIQLVNQHPRVNVLQPGPGVGGHCIAVDPWFIASQSPELSPLIQTARSVNDGKPDFVIKKVGEAAACFEAKHGREPRIACYGLAFKPNVDDLRQSPALDIAGRLHDRFGNALTVVEPHIGELPTALKAASLETVDNAFSQCDLHVLLVAHSQFENVHWETLDQEHVVDSCGLRHKRAT